MIEVELAHWNGQRFVKCACVLSFITAPKIARSTPSRLLHKNSPGQSRVTTSELLEVTLPSLRRTLSSRSWFVSPCHLIMLPIVFSWAESIVGISCMYPRPKLLIEPPVACIFHLTDLSTLNWTWAMLTTRHANKRMSYLLHIASNYCPRNYRSKLRRSVL